MVRASKGDHSPFRGTNGLVVAAAASLDLECQFARVVLTFLLVNAVALCSLSVAKFPSLVCGQEASAHIPRGQ
eukprot:4778635-Amphidinium_carterae.3